MTGLGERHAAITSARIKVGLRDTALGALRKSLDECELPESLNVLSVYTERDDADVLWLHEVWERQPKNGDIAVVLAVLNAISDSIVELSERRELRPRRETAPGGNLAKAVATQRVVILCKLSAKAGCRPALFEALEPFMQVGDGEPGTEVFTLYESVAEPDAIWMHEVYSDAQAHAAHVASPTHQTLKRSDEGTPGAALKALLASPPQNRFLVPWSSIVPKHSDDDLRYVMDRLAIQDLVFNYTHSLDCADPALFQTLWAPEALWHFPQVDGMKMQGLDAIMQSFRGAIGRRLNMHHLASNIVVEIDGDTARGRSKALSTGFQSPHFVSYEDQYVRSADGWKFSSRVITAHLSDPSKLPGPSAR